MRGRVLRSATARLVAIIFILMLVAMIVALVAFQHQAETELRSEQQERIEAIRDDALAAYYDGGLQGLVAFVPTRLAERRDPGLLMAVSREGRGLAGNIAAFAPRALPATRAWVDAVVQLGPDRQSRPARLVVNPLPGGALLVVGHLAGSDAHIVSAFEAGLVFALIVALLLSALVALLMGRIISTRAGAIADTAHALGHGDFTARVEEDGSGDGFDRLRHEMNAMAERIEHLVIELRMVTDSLAHDLRTPVMRLRAMLDRPGVALTPEAAEGVEREMKALGDMLSTALEISRVEAGGDAGRKRPADIAPILADLTEIYTPFAEEHGVAITCHPAPAMAVVDRELLARAISNLIDNAIKYGARTVALELETAPGRVAVHVRDDGPGIAIVDRQSARRRFGRLDASRGQPGAGLGLALVEVIARFHGGELLLGDNHPGLVATILLPATDI